MQNDEVEKDTTQTEKSSSLQRVAKPLFSEKEVRTIVKDFVSAYISGQIKIDFPTAYSILERAKRTKESMDYKKAHERELQVKFQIEELIEIASGTTKSTPEEQETAISELFGRIITMRNSKRIEGVFTEYALEARIRRLEEGIDTVNNLVKEIIDWIMKGVVDK